MKNILLSVAILIASSSQPALAAQPSPACDAKRSAIENQIAAATARGQKAEIAGLKRALAANKAQCTDESLAKERDLKIREAQKKVASREKSLAEAERKGNAKKIAARKEKLEEARHKLTEAEQPIGQ